MNTQAPLALYLRLMNKVNAFGFTDGRLSEGSRRFKLGDTAHCAELVYEPVGRLVFKNLIGGCPDTLIGEGVAAQEAYRITEFGLNLLPWLTAEVDLRLRNQERQVKPQKSTPDEAAICTISGRRFSLTRPSIEEVDLHDIAIGLSRTNRYNGHTKLPYNVCQHSIAVCCAIQWLTDDPRSALAGLLHDASEAYIGDVTSPLKNSAGMEGYKAIERRISATIAEKFGLAYGFMEGEGWEVFEHPIVKWADQEVFAIEAYLVVPEAPWWNKPEPNPLLLSEHNIAGWIRSSNPHQEVASFIATAKDLLARIG